MKKVKTYKGFVIAETNQKEREEEFKDNYEVYSQDEWSMGEGLRNNEMECGSIQHCIDFIDSY